MSNGCCAARGHALAVFNLLALLVRQTRSAQRNKSMQKFNRLGNVGCFFIHRQNLQKEKKTIEY